MPARVKHYSQRWATRIGKSAIAPRVHVDATPVYTCGEKFGQGRCGLDMNAAAAEQLANFKRRLNTWASMTKLGDARFDASWGKLPLFFLGPRDAIAGGAGEDTRGLLALLIYPEGNPRRQLFYVDKAHTPAIGHVVRYDNLAFEGLTIENDFARTTKYNLI